MSPIVLWIVASMALCIDSGETDDHWANFYLQPGVGRSPTVYYQARVGQTYQSIGPMCPTRGSDPIHPKRDPHVMRLGDKVYVIEDVSEANYVVE